jgi:hypothetical protein
MPRKAPWFNAANLTSTEGVEALQRRSPMQMAEDEGDGYVDVVPQPEVMIVVVDEADPHANQKDSSSVQYGVLYVLRTDNVKDKDVFWYRDPDGQRFRWGVVGQARWNIDHALTRFNFGVKQFRIRKGG